MIKTISRRSFLKKCLGVALTSIGISSGGYIYSKYIEPHRLEIKTLTVKHNNIPMSFDQFKIVQFSDTHLGFQYDLGQLKTHIKKINNLKPDIIFFTGDLMDAPNQYPHISDIPTYLKELKAPFGKFAVYGNHDHGGYGTNIYKNVMEQSGFKILQNKTVPVTQTDGSSIFLAGIDDAMLGNPDISRTMRFVPREAFSILLSHAPDLADAASIEGVSFQLSGHSHGGQVQLPFFGALVTPPYGRKYPEGEYHISVKDPLILYVNRGLGTTRLPYRFCSIPEITVINLKAIGK